jgi:hypothetical protein
MRMMSLIPSLLSARGFTGQPRGTDSSSRRSSSTASSASPASALAVRPLARREAQRDDGDGAEECAVECRCMRSLL